MKLSVDSRSLPCCCFTLQHLDLSSILLYKRSFMNSMRHGSFALHPCMAMLLYNIIWRRQSVRCITETERERPDCIVTWTQPVTGAERLMLVYFELEVLYGIMHSMSQMVSCDNENYKYALIVWSLIKKLFLLFQYL